MNKVKSNIHSKNIFKLLKIINRYINLSSNYNELYHIFTKVLDFQV
jgi:hypothetical protein